MTKPHHVMVKPHHVMVKPHHVMVKPHHIMVKPHHIMMKAHHIMVKPHPTMMKPHHVMVKPHHVMTKPHHVITNDHIRKLWLSIHYSAVLSGPFSSLGSLQLLSFWKTQKRREPTIQKGHFAVDGADADTKILLESGVKLASVVTTSFNHKKHSHITS